MTDADVEGDHFDWEPVGSVALNPALEPEIASLTLAA